METLVPHPDFDMTADSLMRQDRAECLVTALSVLAVLHELENTNIEQVRRLPVVRMWRGHEVFLYKYGTALNDAQGGSNAARRQRVLDQHLDWATSGSFSMDPPRWLGDKLLHDAHQAELVRRNPDRYGPKYPLIDATVPLFWPLA